MVKQEHGFSLMEVITAVAVSGVVLLLVSTLSLYAYTQFQTMRARLEAETSANRLEYLLKTYLSQAVNISGAAGLTEVTGANFTIADANATGQWFGNPNTAVAWNRITDLVGDWATLGVFVREIGTGVSGGELAPTAIWFRKPSPTTAGVIFFDNGATPANMAPDYNDQFVSGITRFEFQRQDIAASGAAGSVASLSSLRISYAIRYHLRPGAVTLGWCPRADIDAAVAGCVDANNNFREVEKNFNVVIRNNFRALASVNGTPGDVRTLGRLYFFRVINPARWNL